MTVFAAACKVADKARNKIYMRAEGFPTDDNDFWTSHFSVLVQFLCVFFVEYSDTNISIRFEYNNITYTNYFHIGYSNRRKPFSLFNT